MLFFSYVQYEGGGSEKEEETKAGGVVLVIFFLYGKGEGGGVCVSIIIHNGEGYIEESIMGIGVGDFFAIGGDVFF